MSELLQNFVMEHTEERDDEEENRNMLDRNMPHDQNGLLRDNNTDSEEATSGVRITRETKTTLYLSVAFLLCFTAYMSVEILQTSLNQKDNLGLFSLCGIYGSYFVVGLLAPSVIRLVGIKRMLIIGFLSHIVYIIANFYPHFYTLIPASIIVGLMSPLIWVSLSVFITTTALSYAKNYNEKQHVALSKFNGLFYIIFNGQYIPGNILSSSVFVSDVEVHHRNQTYFLNCGPGGCPASSNSTEIDGPDQMTVYIFLSVLVTVETAALFMLACLVPSMEKSEWSSKVTPLRSLVGCCETFVDYKMLLLAPLLTYSTLVKAVRVTDLTKSYIYCPFGIQMVGFIMASFGGSCALFAFVFSRIAKYTRRYILFAAAVVTDMATFLVLYHWTPTADSLPYVFVIAIVWGAAEAIWQTQINALIGFLFQEKKEPAFANYHTLKATGYTTYFVLSYFLCVKTKLFIVMVWLGVAACLYTVVEIVVKLKIQKLKFLSTINDEAELKPS